MLDDPDACYRVLQSRDSRFDGWFFVAVRTTHIYCRPSCPARTPHRENVSFYPSAAAAQQAGYRACKRCRPDASPGSPEWDARADVVARAMRLIADGVVDTVGVSGLAARLGYSVRQLERLLVAELGAGPLALARAQRAQHARVLIETTALSFSEIAFAAGFASIRQFNDTVQAVFATTPTMLRVRARATPVPAGPGTITLRLPVRAPFHAPGIFGHLIATAVPGVEEWRDGAYRRTLSLAHGPAVVALAPGGASVAPGGASVAPGGASVACTLRLTDVRDLGPAVARCRRLLDLDADPCAVDAALCEDRALRPHVRRAPGRRVPRTVDGAELAMRAVLGQQVSTSSARAVTARIVAAAGHKVDDPDGGLLHCFPSPDDILALSDADLPLPARRRATLRGVAAALSSGTLALDPGADWGAARAALASIGGVGPWTAATVAMRALGDPDAFPAGDLGVRTGAALVGLPAGAELEHHSQQWRPWRAYATQYLWGATPFGSTTEELTCRAS
ncbi:MAG TPA: AlkA N-terminal domain-containing protein [Acidimicrobiales bacterium]|nr:AlkA N-terminal domain-containing protein [Acidimicrobiales bacterium]